MCKNIRKYGCVHRQSTVYGHVFLPRHFVNFPIEVIFIENIKTGNRNQYFYSRTTTKIRLVHKSFVTFKRYTSVSHFYAGSSQLSEFLCQKLLQTIQSFGDHPKIRCHRFKILFSGKNTVILRHHLNSMPKEKNTWFTSWFNTPYYHILYKERNHREAALFMNNLTEYLELAPGSEILDLACGRGRHSKFLYRKGFDVTGVDISEQSIAHAKTYERSRLHFEVHDMRLPYHKKYDAVFNMFTSFGYFPDERDNYRTIQTIKSA